MIHFTAFDIETNGYEIIDPRFRVRMLSCSNSKITLTFKDAAIPAGIAFLESVRNMGDRLVGHNSSMYDRPALLSKFGVNLKCDDTQLMAYLLDETRSASGKHLLRLENLAVSVLGAKPWKDAVTWNWQDTDNWPDNDKRWKVMQNYCERDVNYTRQLAEKLYSQLVSENLVRVYEQLMLPASRALSEIYKRGVAIDAEFIQKEILRQQEIAAEAKARLFAFGLRNPASPKQIKKVLFGDLGCSPVLYTPTGEPSTNELTLKTVKMQWSEDALVEKFINDVLVFRGAKKNENTYLAPYLEHAQKSHDQRVHSSYGLTSTVTGRTSAFNPNIQNIPRDKSIRSMVTHAPNKILMQADLSMVELRIAADRFNEVNMIEALKKGDDRLSHGRGYYKKAAPRDYLRRRTNAKITNFMFLYGAELRRL